MKQFLKIALAVLFVGLVSFAVIKGCVHKKSHFRAAVSQRISSATKASADGFAPTVAKPKMAIILDDWGNNFSLTKNAVEIDRPLTLSILPHLAKSKQIAEEAYAHGLGVMLHMPMEPKNQNERMEPHTILTTTPDAEIVQYLDLALASIPHVQGVNNHQGSKATSDLRVMKTVFGHLKKTELFFVDSYVIATSVAAKTAKEEGVRSAKRDIFLDNINKPEPIKEELRKAIQIAQKHGQVVVIGHDRKTTLQTIKEMVPEIEAAGVHLVLAKELVQ